jgi:hypothetical protein
MVCLMVIVTNHFGVRYNPAKIPDDAEFETADSYIHGPLLRDGGTCASLPVVYAAVGRRLGYPLKIVAAHAENGGHRFLRWDEPAERFNVEINQTGMSTPPDDEFRTGRYAISPADEEYGCILRSKTPRQELSAFLADGGHRWLDLGIRRRAADWFAWAYALSPENRFLKNRLIGTMNAWGDELRALEPPGFPEMIFRWPQRRYAETLPLEYENDLVCLEAWENILKDQEFQQRWWEPLRRGWYVHRPPEAALIEGHLDGCQVSFRYKSAYDYRY